MDFPYRDEMIDDEEKIRLWNKLKQIRLKRYVSDKLHYKSSTKMPKVFYTISGRYQYLLSDPKDYPYTMLSDYFVDHCRVQCRFGSHVSPYQYYQDNKTQINKSLEDQKLEITPYNLREQIYQNHVECSTHNPLIIRYFIDMFKAKNVLDMSSGWGDRLIGSLLGDVENYVGTDPNSCLWPSYESIIKLFRPLTRNKGSYTINHGKFEEIDLPDIGFDLMYSSPPYFDYEIYSEKEGEHSLGNFGEDEWLDTFMYPSVMKIVSALREGGKAVFYFSQARGRTYIEKWFKWMSLLPNMYYLGCMFYSDIFLKKQHPIFIYEKRSTIPKQLYDPPISVRQFKNPVLLNVIEEDRLIGGTKSRAIIPYLRQILKQNPQIEEIIYAGASNGYAQVALSQALRLLKSNIKLTIYLQSTKLPEIAQLVRLSKDLYPVHYIDQPKSLREIEEIIEKRVKGDPKIFQIPFGLHDSEYSNLLHRSLETHLRSYIDKISRLWIVAGSGTILSVLYQILPKTHFLVVQVGKKVCLGSYDENRVTLFISSYKLYQPYPKPIPYPTTASYDGKIWEFSKEFKDDDYIWNVAGIHKILNY